MKYFIPIMLGLAFAGLFGGYTVADTFIDGQSMWPGKVNARGATTGQVLKLNASGIFVPAADDSGTGVIPENTLDNSIITGTGTSWAQNSNVLITDAGAITSSDDLTLNNTAASWSTVDVRGLAGQYKRVLFRTGAASRWDLLSDGVAETGADAGSNLWLRGFDDAGTTATSIFTVNRASGILDHLKGVAFSDNSYVKDDKYLGFGTNLDFQLAYDELTDNRLELGDGTNTFLSIADAGATSTAALTGTLTVSGLTTLSDNLSVTGDILTPDTNHLAFTDGTNTLMRLVDNGTTGALSISGTLTADGVTALNGGLMMDTDKFIVADGTGNTAIAGTLGVTGAVTLDGDMTMNSDLVILGPNGGDGEFRITGPTQLNGGLTMNTDKFIVEDITGNTTIAGSLAITLDTFVDADATPLVSGGNVFKCGATYAEVTALDGGVSGQSVTIIGSMAIGAQTIFYDSVSLNLNAATISLFPGDTLTLVCDGTNWNQTGYSNNNN